MVFLAKSKVGIIKPNQDNEKKVSIVYKVL